MTGQLRVRPTAFGSILALVAAVGLSGLASASEPAVAATVLAVAGGTLVLGAAGAVASAFSARVDLLRGRDAAAGENVALQVSGRFPLPWLEARVAGSRWTTLDAGGSELILERAGRGLYRSFNVELRSLGPFGVLRVCRLASLPLARPVVVTPIPTAVAWSPPEGTGEDERRDGHAAGDSSVRSLRPYTVGDPPHTVHWPTSARTGVLHVRELDAPARYAVAIVLRLGHEKEAAERAVSRAAGMGLLALRLDCALTICLHAEGRSVTAEIGTPGELMRLLAAAGAGPPGLPPPGRQLVEVSG